MPLIAGWEHDEAHACAQATDAAVTGAPVGSGEGAPSRYRGACSGGRAQIPFTHRLNPKFSGRKASQNGAAAPPWGSIGRFIKSEAV